MSEILGDKLNIIYEDTLLEITPELMKKTILKQNKEIERLHSIIKEVREKIENTKFAFDFDKEVKKLAFDLTYTKEGQELLKILGEEQDNGRT